MDHPLGAGSQRADRVDFDRRVRVEFRGAQISSDGGLLVMRELDDALGLSELASAALRDTRRGKNTIHRLDGLFRQSVFGRLAGYEDVNDAERLALDPVMRQVVGGRAVDAQAASASQMGRFETETLALLETGGPGPRHRPVCWPRPWGTLLPGRRGLRDPRALYATGRGAVFLRHPVACQQRPAREDRPSAHTARG